MSNEIKAQAVMDFVEMIRGAYASGFIDNHPTNYDIYRSAQMHVKDRYGVETNNWDDELAEKSRKDDNDQLTGEVSELRKALSIKESECKALSQRNFNLALRNKQLEEKLADVWDALYGKGFEVVGFHLNGDLEPMDNFFDSNDWNF
ncbi:hypothetical protein [Salinivibrio kushneri]|uniref:hypothetical protein n=1 Tax=Salinivibrio kushneri TaxID=1908198 RepID=UPI0009889BE6|nr:hypothetical protein [Salinivibrio kushneri]OOE71729.1 hypothetical protein BZG19_02115 [Salinivibrio kushneri]